MFEEGELPRESNVQILHVVNSDKPAEVQGIGTKDKEIDVIR